MNAFKQMLAELAASKKFNVTLIGVVLAIAAKFGLNLDPELTATIVAALIAVYVLAQGAADLKKEAAKIESVTATALGKPPSEGAKKAAKKIAASVAAKE